MVTGAANLKLETSTIKGSVEKPTLGFTFANEHSFYHKVIMRSINRTLLPELRKNEFVIPGRHGTIDYGLNTYEKRYISVEINLIRNKMTDLREHVREVAKWLTKTGLLIFDDEPEKAYQAKIYSNIDVEQITTTGVSEITFECQPFAESLNYIQKNVLNIITNNYEIECDVKGTSETCPIITIKNTGNDTIDNIIITRKVAL